MMSARRTPLRSLFLATLLAAGLASPAGAADNQFGGWTVTCSTRIYCVAATYAYSEGGSRAVFKLERGPAPASKVFVTTGPSEPLALGMRVDVDIFGLSEPYGVYGEVRRIYDGNEMTFAGEARRTFVERLRQGVVADISVEFGGDTGTITYSVRLGGLTLALLEIDRRQGRLDREDAIVAWGGGRIVTPEADGSAPEPPVAQTALAVTGAAAGPPTVAAYDLIYTAGELPSGVAGAGRDGLGCALDEAVETFGAQVIEFSTGAQLHIVPCRPADANVEAYVVWRAGPDARDEVLEFARTDSEETSTLMTNPEYDRQSGTITSHGYYSPEYDCGYFSAWSFDVVVARLELAEERVKDNCDGAVVPPTTWPLVR